MEDPTYEKNVFVQQADCIDRAQCLSDVSYHVRLNLPRGDWYSGCFKTDFKVNEAPTTDLFFDFRGIKIAQYSINGVAVADEARFFKNHHVTLPSSMLKVGETNTVELFFVNKYRKDGVGLHSFVDKVDAQQYLYT